MNYYSNDQCVIAKKIFDECHTLFVYDLETTGFSPEKERIIELSGIKYRIDNKSLIEESRITVYIKPNSPLSEKITEITGYTDAFFADKSSEPMAFHCIREYMKNVDAVCGYNNSTFDDEFMKNLYKRYDEEIPYVYSLDCLCAARQFLPKKDLPNYKLASVASHLGVDGDIDYHKAHDDVIATARILNVLLGELLDNTATPSEEKETPRVLSIAFWEGYRGFSRIYVTTNKGSVYYDIRNKSWGGKDVDPNELNMDEVLKCCFEKTGTSNESEFAKFRGNIKC